GRLSGQLRGAGEFKCLLHLAEQLAHATGFDRLDFQARQSHLQPADELRKLFPLWGSRSAVGRRALRFAIRPVLGARAEQQRILETLRLKVMEQILIGPEAAVAVKTAVPFV